MAAERGESHKLRNASVGKSRAAREGTENVTETLMMLRILGTGNTQNRLDRGKVS